MGATPGNEVAWETQLLSSRAMRAVDDNRHPDITGDQTIPKSRHGGLPREYVHMLTLHAQTAVLCHETTIVLRSPLEFPWQTLVLGNVNGGSERQNLGINCNRQKRRDRLSRGATSPRKFCHVENVKADLLTCTWTHGGTFAIATAEAYGVARRQKPAALYTKRFEEAPWNGRPRSTLTVVERYILARVVTFNWKIIVGVLECPYDLAFNWGSFGRNARA